MPEPSMRQARAREIRVLSVLSAGHFLFFNSYGSINVAVPMIQADFGASLSAVQWIATMGLVLSSSLALCLGRAGDIVGRNPLYKIGVTLYGLGSALAALSQTLPQLVGCRVVMTVGLAMAMPMSTAITAAVSRPGRTGLSLGILLSSGAVGRATGPALGGFFLHLAGWRAVFLANALIGLAVSIAVWRLLRAPEDRSRGPFDFVGATVLILGYPSLLVGLSLGVNSGWGSPLVPWWFLLGAVAFAVFVAREARGRRPLVPLPVVTEFPMAIAFVTMMLVSATYFPLLMLTPLYLQNVLDMAPLPLGLILTALPVTAAVCSPVSGRLADRVEPALLVAAGQASVAAGVLLFAGLDEGSSATGVLLAMAFVGAGIGLVLPANQKTVFHLSPPEHYGVAGGLLSACGPGAGALGIGVVVALIEGMAAGDPAAYLPAQRVAALALLPLPLLALVLVLLRRARIGGLHAAPEAAAGSGAVAGARRRR